MIRWMHPSFQNISLLMLCRECQWKFWFNAFECVDGSSGDNEIFNWFQLGFNLRQSRQDPCCHLNIPGRSPPPISTSSFSAPASLRYPARAERPGQRPSAGLPANLPALPQLSLTWDETPPLIGQNFRKSQSQTETEARLAQPEQASSALASETKWRVMFWVSENRKGEKFGCCRLWVQGVCSEIREQSLNYPRRAGGWHKKRWVNHFPRKTIAPNISLFKRDLKEFICTAKECCSNKFILRLKDLLESQTKLPLVLRVLGRNPSWRISL